MHEVSLGGSISDYLTAEARKRSTYEDLRQALAKFLVEERGFAPSLLRPRHAVHYAVKGELFARQADIAVFSPSASLLMLVVFCPGQVHTYMREVTAMARLALPCPSPLAVVTDMRTAELFAVQDGSILAKGFAAFPHSEYLEKLAAGRAPPSLNEEHRDKESRILHAYTGFLKSCCAENCPPG